MKVNIPICCYIYLDNKHLTLYDIHCTTCTGTVYSRWHNVHCTILYTVRCTVYNVQYTVYFTHYTRYVVWYAVYDVHSTT